MIILAPVVRVLQLAGSWRAYFLMRRSPRADRGGFGGEGPTCRLRTVRRSEERSTDGVGGDPTLKKAAEISLAGDRSGGKQIKMVELQRPMITSSFLLITH